jgi:hypothetical protein
MKRFLLTLALVAAMLAVSAPAAQAQYGYYGTFRGGRTPTMTHVRSQSTGIYIQSYAPPQGYGYYGEAYGYGPTYGYGPGYGYGRGYGYGPDCRHHHHHHGYSPYGYGGSGISIRW